MNPKTQEELIEVLKQIAGELSSISIELENLNSKDFSNSNSDIAKNIADIGIDVVDQLKGIKRCC